MSGEKTEEKPFEGLELAREYCEASKMISSFSTWSQSHENLFSGLSSYSAPKVTSKVGLTLSRDFKSHS